MSINSGDFLDSARLCLEQDDEVSYRNCISRAYYGMFHESMASLKHVPFYKFSRHRGLIVYMTSAAECKQEPYDKHQLKVMGYNLKQMRDCRNEADYDITRVTISREIAESGMAAADIFFNKWADIKQSETD
ncbi:HEPN domain-containing protein [Salmonella enterica]|nr:HEPN domain-containing protein [Salmonella enterica]EJB2593629.1 HEPN domain-containing protein [Salmonella enterica]ELS6506685.1 HEPN domain-containing protein [Salmonella enterica]HBJ6961138.1 HEPN domain-containing protein [Salmonella enterica subsp. enterica serovar Duisburg]